MAGIVGFFSRTPRLADDVRARLEAMQREMTTRPGHRQASHCSAFGAIGVSGPGVFDGSVAVHEAIDGGSLVADGETYHLADAHGAALRGAAAWRAAAQAGLIDDGRGLASVDGIYAVAHLTSTPDPCLTLFTDRYASRRLYYADLGAWFVFASEMAPLAAWLGSDAAIDWDAVDDSVSFGSAIGDRTWLRQVRLFPPATIARVTPSAARFVRYWHWHDAPPPGTHARRDRLDELHDKWRGAIAARTHGGRLGLQLTGGLDSRLILGELHAQGHTVPAVTYGQPGADDVRFAERCAKKMRAPWTFWPVPGANWVARRAAHSVAHDGIVDIVNAHHVDLVDRIGELMDVEMSGYLGDAVMGATGLDQPAASMLHLLPYWQSPVAVPVDVVSERLLAEVGKVDSPRTWLLENKWRRATNAWPHLAVNELDVRKPFMDYALVDFCAGLPRSDRQQPPQRALLKRFYPALARVPWQKTGVAPIRGRLPVTAIKGVRLAYRTATRAASALGRRPSPWIRTACDIDGWCADPAVRRAVAGPLTDPSSILRARFGAQAIDDTIRQAFDDRMVAVEVPFNLLRAELVLRRFQSIAARHVRYRTA